MMKTTTTVAALVAALGLTLAGCTSPVDPGPTSPIPSPDATIGPEDPSGDVVVDRDPQGPLPTIDFDADGLPTMTRVEAEPPTVISVQTLQAGSGASVTAGDFITVHYAGFLWDDGAEFDSSFGDEEPVSFLLDEFMDGWTYGLVGTKVGDRVLLVVPPDYGYGDLEDETIPAGSTLVFVIDVVNAMAITTDALTQATPTGAALPEGLSIAGDLGTEPTLVFAADAPEPTETQVIVIAEGAGPVITETDTLLYHAAGAYWGEESSSSWSGSFEQAEYGGGEETIGQTVGSRLLLVYPADDEFDEEAEVVLLDLLAVIPGQ